MMGGIEVRGLTRTFGGLRAVDQVSFSAARGRLTGFVGGNGAGKSTTMRMIMGLLAPDSGEVFFDGEPIQRAQRVRIGYMPEERGLYPKQKVISQLRYFARLSGQPGPEAENTIQGLLARFNLTERANDVAEKLSLGNQQRVQIIAALLGDPIALVLDEPFSGLDPDAANDISEVLREQAAAGMPILFSSHQLDLVERLCDDLVVLAAGRIVAAGPVETLREAGPVRYRFEVPGDAAWISQAPGIEVVETADSAAIIAPESDAALQQLVAAAVDHGGVRELHRLVPSLADVYREVTR